MKTLPPPGEQINQTYFWDELEMMSSSWRDLTIPPVNARMHSGKFHGRHGCACDPKLGQEMGKLSEYLCEEFWHHKDDKRFRQEGHSCSSRVTKNTGTAQGISNRGRCVRTGAVPELNIIVGTAIVAQSWCFCFPVAVPVIVWMSGARNLGPA